MWQTDRRAERLALASRLGAATTVDVSREELLPTLVRDRFAPDVVMECSGSPEAFAVALKAVRPGGRVGVLGYYADDQASNSTKRHHDARSRVIGAVCPTGAWDAAVGLIAGGRVNTDALITHVMPLERFEEAAGSRARRRRRCQGGPGSVARVMARQPLGLPSPGCTSGLRESVAPFSPRRCGAAGHPAALHLTRWLLPDDRVPAVRDLLDRRRKRGQAAGEVNLAVGTLR